MPTSHRPAMLATGTLLLLAAFGASSASAFQQIVPSRQKSAPTPLFPTLFASSPSSTVEKPSRTRSRPNDKTGGPIQTLDSVSDFISYLDDAPRDSLAVVEFYGKNCPLCKRVSLKYKKIANIYSKQGVSFAEMENHRVNKPVMDVLGIRKFPFLHVYRNGQCVAAHGTESSTAFEGIVRDTIQRELDMTEQDWEQFLTAFAGHIQQGTDRINQLRELLAQQEEPEEAVQR